MANMLPRTTTEKQKDMHVVKIAVELESKVPQLTKFDRRTPLTGIIQDLCPFWGIADHDNYALRFDQHNNKHYVTEKNRGEVKNGSVLKLHHSPAKIAADFLRTLRSATADAAERAAVLHELIAYSGDPTFAAEFINQQGFELIVQLIEADDTPVEQLRNALLSFVELMEHGIVLWNSLRPAFIERQLQCVRQPRRVGPDAVQAALSNLENIVHSSTAPERITPIEQQVTFDGCVLALLQDAANARTQQNTLALVNALFVRAATAERRREIAAAFASKQYRNVLQTMVMPPTVGTELAHQLYVLQTLTMGLLEARMMQPATGAGALQSQTNTLGGGAAAAAAAGGGGLNNVSAGGQQVSTAGGSQTDVSDQPTASEKIVELRRIAFQDDPHNNSHHHLDSRSKQTQLAGNYKKLGFRCNLNPEQDFVDTPPGMLALDCMLYFARNYAAAYTAIVHENACRGAEHECPFGRTAIELVRQLCDILHIGEAPSDQGTEYCTMFFAHDHPFEETFCAAVQVLHRTWKDMRATAEDFSKVFSVLREQITRTLAERPVSVDDFRLKIAHYTYARITELRQQERTSKEECKSSASAIVSLREKITPDIVRLIKQQRFNYLKEGTRFSKYVGNARTKDKYWYARLSANHKVIHWADCDEKSVPAVEDLSNKLAIADCRQLLVGHEVPPEVKVKKSAALCFSLWYENEASGTTKQMLNFVAPDEAAFDYWTDGLYALLEQPMVSARKTDDLETLLSMEIKLRLLDTEGVDISREPPPVPADPDNYDFCFES